MPVMVSDYTSYEELLGCWKRISPMPVLHSETGQSLSIDELRKEVGADSTGTHIHTEGRQRDTHTHEPRLHRTSSTL